jgi:hypothetical protein
MKSLKTYALSFKLDYPHFSQMRFLIPILGKTISCLKYKILKMNYLRKK